MTPGTQTRPLAFDLEAASLPFRGLSRPTGASSRERARRRRGALDLVATPGPRDWADAAAASPIAIMPDVTMASPRHAAHPGPMATSVPGVAA